MAAIAISLLQLWVFAGFIVLKPGLAAPAGELVRVEDGAESEGTLLYTAVIARRANALEVLRAMLDEDVGLTPLRENLPPEMSWREYAAFMHRLMIESQSTAAAVAFRNLGYRVGVQNLVEVGRVVAESPADGVLRAGDVVLAIDDVPVRTVIEASRQMRGRSVGDPVTLRVRRQVGGEFTVKLETVAVDQAENRPGVGVFLRQVHEIDFPRPVRFVEEGISGSSAGLMLALEVYDQLTPGTLTKRNTLVAGTGALRLDGGVEPVEGVRQKVTAAESRGADVFLVPRANAVEAINAAQRIKIIPVETFDQAIRELQRLSAEE